MDQNKTRTAIANGETALGIEFGSTRLKAVLIGKDAAPIASGSHEWENRYENGVWTYSLTDTWKGLQDSYHKLSAEVLEKYGVTLQAIGAIGFSAMMHGYLAFDRGGNLLAPFRSCIGDTDGQVHRPSFALDARHDAGGADADPVPHPVGPSRA